MEVLVDALQGMLQLERLTFLLIGILGGLVVGFLPGLGGTAGLAILLPFVFGMDPITGVGLLIGMSAVTTTSDTFPAVLLGIPGTAGSQATVVDGHPLAKRGEAARALGAGFSASMLGGLVGAVTLASLVFVARPLVLAFGSPELFMLVVLGLATVAMVSEGSIVRGLVVGFVGLFIGAIGGAPAAPIYRYTFGSLYLSDGISVVLITLGLFAIPEIVVLLRQSPTGAHVTELTGSIGQGIRDTLRNKRLVVANGMLGAAVGMIPGIGGAVIDWMAYGFSKRFLRNTQDFGSGDIRGVIAPESANNAKEGGTLLPTLIFGIPGSGSAAVIMGGLILMGIEPGPNLVEENISITLSIVWSLAIANVVAAALCILLAGRVARLTLLPGRRLGVVLLPIIFIAAYQTSGNIGDIIVLLLIGMLGHFMMQNRWPRAPLLIGFILSIGAERYLILSMQRYGFGWVTRPGVIIIGMIVAAILLVGIRSSSLGAPDELAGDRVGS